jgi:hypothetical protein
MTLFSLSFHPNESYSFMKNILIGKCGRVGYFLLYTRYCTGQSVLVPFDVFSPKEQLPSYFLPYRKILRIEGIKLLGHVFVIFNLLCIASNFPLPLTFHAVYPWLFIEYILSHLVYQSRVLGALLSKASVLNTEYTECQAFFPVVRIESPHPLTRKGGFSSPHCVQGGGDTIACGGGLGGTQRRGRHSGTLCIL